MLSRIKNVAVFLCDKRKGFDLEQKDKDTDRVLRWLFRRSHKVYMLFALIVQYFRGICLKK